MDFALHACRFRFRCVDSLYFEDGKSGNILRGALGTVLRRLACHPACPGAKECPERFTCAYARLFEPTAWGPGPSGFADWPRPFVLRAGHLDGRTLPPAAEFEFDLHVFDLQEAALVWLVMTYAEMAREGMGPRRGRVRLESVLGLGPDGIPVSPVFTATTEELAHPSPILLSLEPLSRPVSNVRLEFATPTELRSNDQVVMEPPFHVLFSRIRDRLSALSSFYGQGPLEIDFRGMGDRARSVELKSSRIQWRSGERRSSKTGLRHSLGGIVGEAEYEGDLAEFVPYLVAAYWTGVGKQTVWGKGAVRLMEIR